MKNIDNDSRATLINHISRLEGQLASVKAELKKEDLDCTKASTTLHAASRSFASLRKSFIQCFLEKNYLKSTADSKNSQYLSLLQIING